MNLEQAEACMVEKLISQWCQTWSVKPDTIKKEFSVDATGRLQIDLSVELKVPITSVKTRLLILSRQDEPPTTEFTPPQEA
jgi:hypothetical protein